MGDDLKLSKLTPTPIPSLIREGSTHAATCNRKRKAAFTISEGATHVAHSHNISRAAFTLAEVLITLGIIGVVAAMTMPTIISNHNKAVVVTKLKSAQSIITQMLTMAIVDHGDPNTWDFNNALGAEISETESLIKSLTEKYFLPYLNDAKHSGYMSLKEAGYEPYKTADGRYNYSNLGDESKKQYVIELANGITIFVYMNSSTISGKLTSVLLYIDVNGKKKPNVFGRDTFVANIDSTTGQFKWLYSSLTHEQIIKECSGNGLSCGALIQHDGWQITDKYPIRI